MKSICIFHGVVMEKDDDDPLRACGSSDGIAATTKGAKCRPILQNHYNSRGRGCATKITRRSFLSITLPKRRVIVPKRPGTPQGLSNLDFFYSRINQRGQDVEKVLASTTLIIDKNGISSSWRSPSNTRDNWGEMDAAVGFDNANIGPDP
jgi:hypothetical protein